MIACALALLVAAPEQSPMVSRSQTITLKVIDRNQVADAIVAKTDELGGYFTTRNDQQVDLRVPQTKLADVAPDDLMDPQYERGWHVSLARHDPLDLARDDRIRIWRDLRERWPAVRARTLRPRVVGPAGE